MDYCIVYRFSHTSNWFEFDQTDYNIGFLNYINKVEKAIMISCVLLNLVLCVFIIVYLFWLHFLLYSMLYFPRCLVEISKLEIAEICSGNDCDTSRIILALGS